jgi:hypothetical protein
MCFFCFLGIYFLVQRDRFTPQFSKGNQDILSEKMVPEVDGAL